MIISSITSRRPARSLQNQNQTAFKATPPQIMKAVADANICNGKKNFLAGLGNYFNNVQEAMSKIKEAPKEFIYKLGQKNEIPESLKKVEVNGLNLEKLDEGLNTKPFKCSPTSTCSCGAGKTQSELVKDLLKIIGVEEPDIIKLTK